MSSTCDRCSKPCKSAGGLKLHQKKCKAIAPIIAPQEVIATETVAPIIAPQEVAANLPAMLPPINIPAIIYSESTSRDFPTRADSPVRMVTDVSYDSDSEEGPIISEATYTLKAMRENYPTCHYIFMLEESGPITRRSFHGFEDLKDAYRWFVPHTRNTKVAVHCVKDAKKPMKIMLDIDIAKSGGHMEQHRDIAKDAASALVAVFGEYKQRLLNYDVSRNIRDDKVGYHIDTEIAVANKAAYGVIIDAVRKHMKPEYQEYVDRVPGDNMRMPFTHKKGIQLLPTVLEANYTITREKFDFLVPTNTEKCVILDVVIPVQPKSEHVEITDSHVAAAEVIINDYFSKLGHKLNFWWSETRFHVPSGQHCPVCNEVHNSQNNYINISKNGTPWYNCRQKRGEGLPLAPKVKKPKVVEKPKPSDNSWMGGHAHSGAYEGMPSPEEMAELMRRTGRPIVPDDDLVPSAQAPPAPTYKAFDASDPYCWVDFEKEFGMMKFASWDECIAKTTPCLNRVLAFVSQSTSYFTVVDDRKRDCRYSFNEYIGYADPHINKYKSMDFKPNMPHTEELFNMWQGYAAKDLGDEALNADSALAESKLAPLLTFIREIICDSNKETYDYLMQWLSFVLFRPEIAPHSVMGLGRIPSSLSYGAT